MNVRGAVAADMAAVRDLYNALIPTTTVAWTESLQEASIRFHENLGFTVVARMPEVGRKFDRWLDLVLMQRVIP